MEGRRTQGRTERGREGRKKGGDRTKKGGKEGRRRQRGSRSTSKQSRNQGLTLLREEFLGYSGIVAK